MTADSSLSSPTPTTREAREEALRAMIAAQPGATINHSRMLAAVEALGWRPAALAVPAGKAEAPEKDALARALYIEHKRRVEPAWGYDEPPHIWDTQIAVNPASKTTLDFWTERAEDLLALLAPVAGKAVQGDDEAPEPGATLDDVLRFYFPRDWMQLRENLRQETGR